MDADPRSLVIVDHQRCSIFHYCCENKNDVLLATVLNLLRRLSSNQSVRVQVCRSTFLTAQSSSLLGVAKPHRIEHR